MIHCRAGHACSRERNDDVLDLIDPHELAQAALGGPDRDFTPLPRAALCLFSTTKGAQSPRDRTSTRGRVQHACGRPRLHPLRLTDNGLAAFYRRYNACCNEHRFEDLAEFVARDVVINGTDRGLDAYAEGLRAVVRAFPDYHWELRHLLVDPPWIAAHFAETGTHRGPFLGVPATGRPVCTREFAF